MTNKKILFILQNFEGGGAERVFINIANGFFEAGHEVSFLLGEKKGVYFDLVHPTIQVRELKALSLFSYLRKLPAALKKGKYSHIFTASDNISIATIISRRITRIKPVVICTLHYNLNFMLSLLPWANRKWVKWSNRYIISAADKLVAVSRGVEKGFRIGTGKNVPQLTTIYNPVFDEGIYLKAAAPVTDELFKNKKRTLITVGRLSKQKNQYCLLYAFSKLYQRDKNIQLIILGIGPLEDELKQLSSALQIQEAVHFLGFKQNPFCYIQQSELFILSSQFEGLPTVIIEALALGINVVSTDCNSGPAEILEDGKLGWLCRVNDVEDLTEKIVQAMDKPKPKEDLIKAAQQYNNKHIISHYLDII